MVSLDGCIFLLAQSKFVQKFQILIGIDICLGQHVALAYECFYHGRFMDALHKNVPLSQVMKNLIVKHGNLDFNSWKSILVMILSHIIDGIGHPLIAYYFYGGKLSGAFSWPVIISTCMHSRLQNIIHTFQHRRKVFPFMQDLMCALQTLQIHSALHAHLKQRTHLSY